MSEPLTPARRETPGGNYRAFLKGSPALTGAQHMPLTEAIFNLLTYVACLCGVYAIAVIALTL